MSIYCTCQHNICFESITALPYAMKTIFCQLETKISLKYFHIDPKDQS